MTPIKGLATWRFFLSSAERLDEYCALRFQPLLQPRGAIAVAAGPGFASVFVAALAAVVCILHFREIEVLFPVGRSSCSGVGQ